MTEQPPTTVEPMPFVRCPRCGEGPVDGWEMKAGAIYRSDYGGPGGTPGHFVVRGGEPEPPRSAYNSAKSWPDGDVFTVNPCGHEVTREQLAALLAEAESKRQRA